MLRTVNKAAQKVIWGSLYGFSNTTQRVKQNIHGSTLFSSYACVTAGYRTIHFSSLISKQTFYSYHLLTEQMNHRYCSLKGPSIPNVNHTDGLFSVSIDGKGCATLEYEYEEKSNCFTILHTNVPSPMKGCNIGKLLAQEALEFALAKNFKLKVECEFVQHYINKYHPKFKKLF